MEPRDLKIADLQKGLIFVYKGVDVARKGTCFGVPILKYSDETYFSGSSTLHVHKQGNLIVICKEFFMHMVTRERFRNIRLDRINLEKVFVLNEQGTSFFRTYSELDKLRLVEIGWADVKVKSANISDYRSGIGFGLKNVRGGILRRGRELLKDCFDWVGIDVELGPENDFFEWEIEILGFEQLQ